jgi:class 3 adenylate cyclase
MQICPKCGEENSERARFCQACATPLVADTAPLPEARKTVTVVFSDVTGSTNLGERLDPESLRRVMSRYFEAMRQALERHGGTVEKFIGDAVMAVFGIPRLHEDDALRAVRATMEMQAALDDLNQELEQNWGVRLQIRTGVNTGEVVAGDLSAGQTLVTGDTVNVAARLEQAAQPGEILMGEATYRLVRDAAVVERLESLTLKGKEEPVPALRLLEVKAGAPGFARHLDSPMVGREREQALLQHTFERCVGDRSCHLFTVLGAAGAGKSRLVEEFLSTVGNEAVVLRGRCLPYGEGITFWPVQEIVKQAAGIGDGDTPEEAGERIAGLLGSEEDASIIADRVAGAIGLAEAGAAPEETLWAVRKLLEILAGQSPLVVLFDDIHWADPTFLDLVEHVADWSRDAPILLVCVARPELLDHRTAWGGGKKKLFVSGTSSSAMRRTTRCPRNCGRSCTSSLLPGWNEPPEGGSGSMRRFWAITSSKPIATGRSWDPWTREPHRWRPEPPRGWQRRDAGHVTAATCVRRSICSRGQMASFRAMNLPGWRYCCSWERCSWRLATSQRARVC